MQRFCQLLQALETSNKTSDKLAAMVAYFAQTPPQDAAWALWFICGNKLSLGIPAKRLRGWATALSGHPAWLVEACYERVADLAETAALLIAPPATDFAGKVNRPAGSLAEFIEAQLLPLRYWDEGFQLPMIREACAQLDLRGRLVFFKMLTGAFRSGVSRALAVRALAAHFQLEPAIVTHRLMGDWFPDHRFFERIGAADEDPQLRALRPYPFFLASPLSGPAADLGAVADWQAEWKWDGIRAQLMLRGDICQLWSRGEERLTEAFPEIVTAAAATLPPATVLDGEILAWRDGQPLPFHQLQRRIARRDPDATIRQAVPVAFLAYDCLEWQGSDIRTQPLHLRRQYLAEALRRADCPLLRISPQIAFATWVELGQLWQQARDRNVEGIMLKRLNSPYRTGRVRGDWWKWKAEPFTADLVLLYAQAGHGNRSGLYTDYTLGAWHKGQLLPVAKAYSGLTRAELHAVDRWIKQHTLTKRGPIRTVPPELVFEIGFEGIQPSNRHKSGFAMRFPRILRWRRDKPAAEADSIAHLQRLQ